MNREMIPINCEVMTDDQIERLINLSKSKAGISAKENSFIAERINNMEPNIAKKKNRLIPIIAVTAAVLTVGVAGVIGVYILNMNGIKTGIPEAGVKFAAVGYDNYTINDIVFGYVDDNIVISLDASDDSYDDWIHENGYGGKYPNFENPLAFSNGAITWTTQKSEDNHRVYEAVTGPLYIYAVSMTKEYDNMIHMHYTVESDNSIITVCYDNIAYPNGLESEPIQFERTFIFDIENASLDNIPKLDRENKEYINSLCEQYLGYTYYKD